MSPPPSSASPPDERAPAARGDGRPAEIHAMTGQQNRTEVTTGNPSVRGTKLQPLNDPAQVAADLVAKRGTRFAADVAAELERLIGGAR